MIIYASVVIAFTLTSWIWYAVSIRRLNREFDDYCKHYKDKEM